jgi:hypothetical protein
MVGSTFICDFLPRRFCKFFRQPRPAGSLPDFAAESCRNSYPLHYRAAFAFSSLLYPLPQQRALRRRLPRIGRDIGLALFCLNDTNDVVPAFTPAAFVSVCSNAVVEATGCVPFG